MLCVFFQFVLKKVKQYAGILLWHTTTALCQIRVCHSFHHILLAKVQWAWVHRVDLQINTRRLAEAGAHCQFSTDKNPSTLSSPSADRERVKRHTMSTHVTELVTQALPQPQPPCSFSNRLQPRDARSFQHCVFSQVDDLQPFGGAWLRLGGGLCHHCLQLLVARSHCLLQQFTHSIERG
jgi:hypothetical protein